MSTSLAVKSGAIALLPDPSAGTPISLPESNSTPYVTIISVKSSKFSEYKETVKDLADGDPLLIRPDEPPKKLSPFRYILVTARQLWADFDETYDYTQVVFEDPGKESKLKECIESVLLLLGRSAIVPARATWMKARLDGVRPAIKESLLTGKPEWAARSAEHAFAVKHAPHANCRFVATVKTFPQTFKNGFKGIAASSTIAPITAAELDALNAWSNKDGSSDDLAAVTDAFNNRMADYEECA